MKRLLYILMLSASALAVAAPLDAQVADANWARVTATVESVFDFRIDGADHTQASPAVYNFGSVTNTGMNNGVVVGPRAFYLRSGAFTWTVASAPRRTVDISLQNGAKLAGPTPGAMALNQLSIRMTVLSQAAGGTGTSQGLRPVSVAKTLLVDNVLAGFGSSTAAGEIDLELEVDGNDQPGTNTWEIQLVAEEV